MSVVTIAWDETDPADSRNLGLGAGDIRSTKTNLRGGLAAEHLWPSTGGGSGAHLLGSARAFVGTASAVSSSDTDGRFMITSDTSKLHHVASAKTQVLGGQYVTFGAGMNLPHLGLPGYHSSITQCFAVEAGVGRMVTASASTGISLQASYVTAFGLVQRQTQVGDTTAQDFPAFEGMISGAATATITSYNTVGNLAAPSSNYTFSWIVLGVTALSAV